MNQTATPRRGLRLTALLVALAGAAFAAVWFVTQKAGEEGPMTSTISDAELATAADTRVFFGHQSVGLNILDGIPTVYEGRDADPPVITETNGPLDGSGVAHAFIGKNTDPALKMADTKKLLADGLGSWADVAFFKFCYVDITADTDVNGLFAQYRRTYGRTGGGLLRHDVPVRDGAADHAHQLHRQGQGTRRSRQRQYGRQRRP